MEEAATSSTLATWTRGDVARHLGVSVTTVRRVEGRVLHPRVNEHGVNYFEVTEVRELKATREQRPAVRQRETEGQAAARVFELLRNGAGLRDIVIRAKVTPTGVRALYAEWLVSLQEGEQRRRDDLMAAEDARARARLKREQQTWDRATR